MWQRSEIAIRPTLWTLVLQSNEQFCCWREFGLCDRPKERSAHLSLEFTENLFDKFVLSQETANVALTALS